MLTAFSLAVFTKGSNYITCYRYCLCGHLRSGNLAGPAGNRPCSVLRVVGFNGLHWVRNHDTFGRWTGSDKDPGK